MKCLICSSKMAKQYHQLFDDRYGAPGQNDIYECSNCGFARIFPGLRKGEIGLFYKKYYPLSTFKTDDLKKQAKLISPFRSWAQGTNNICHLYAKKGEKVLDVGSGSGISLLELKLLGAEGYGVEPDPAAQKLAKALKLRVKQGFIDDRPFPNIRFDLVTASQVIEHEPNPRGFLKIARKRLAPKGRLILSFPNYNGLYRLIFGKKWLNWHVPYHFNFFSKKAVFLLAHQAGFEVKSLKTITPNLWTVLQALMLLDKSKEGVPSVFWKSQGSGSRKQINRNNIFKTIHQILLAVAIVLIAPINRVVDLLGLGESYLVILKPTKSR